MGDISSQEKKHPNESIETQKKQRLAQPPPHFICVSLFVVENRRKIGEKIWYVCTISAFLTWERLVGKDVGRAGPDAKPGRSGN